MIVGAAGVRANCQDTVERSFYGEYLVRQELCAHRDYERTLLLKSLQYDAVAYVKAILSTNNEYFSFSMFSSVPTYPSRYPLCTQVQMFSANFCQVIQLHLLLIRVSINNASIVFVELC